MTLLSAHRDILFSHPANYTSACTTELGFTTKLQDEFEKCGVRAITLPLNDVESPHGWIKDLNETQDTSVNFPVIADQDHKVSELYDFIHPNTSETLIARSLMMIDPNKKVCLIMTYPALRGHNFHEVLHGRDSLQLTDQQKTRNSASKEKLKIRF